MCWKSIRGLRAPCPSFPRRPACNLAKDRRPLHGRQSFAGPGRDCESFPRITRSRKRCSRSSNSRRRYHPGAGDEVHRRSDGVGTPSRKPSSSRSWPQACACLVAGKVPVGQGRRQGQSRRNGSRPGSLPVSIWWRRGYRHAIEAAGHCRCSRWNKVTEGVRTSST